MSHVQTAPFRPAMLLASDGFAAPPGFAVQLDAVPADLRIPPPPARIRWIPRRPAEPAWRQALRWSLLGLASGWAMGEAALLLLAP